MPWREMGASLALLLLLGSPAHADDPKLAPGRDPGGMAVAVLADGFDYLQPDLAKVLARDGEGEAIAWDALDGDHRPFQGDGRGTDIGKAAAARGGVRIVAVRVATEDPASLAKGIAFAAGTPAVVVLVALDASARDAHKVVLSAAERFKTQLFVMSLPGVTADEKKRSETSGNLVLIDASGDALLGAKAVAHVFGCNRGALTGATGTELKAAFLERVGEAPSAGCEPEGGAKAD